MSRILITGASGFVGTHLVRELLTDKNNEIYAAVFGRGEALKELLPADHIIAGDLTNSGFTQRLIQTSQPDVVYHLAALAVVQDSIEKAGQVLTANLLLQYNVLESIKRHSPHARVIAICSAHEYGLVSPSDIPIDEDTPLKPLNPYAVSKAAQDLLAYQYFLAYNLDVVRLRPFNHTGTGQTPDFVIPALAKQFVEIKQGKREPKIEIGNTESVRDFTDVRDMVKAYVLAAAKCQSGEVYNIGYGKGISVGEIISAFEEIAGVKVEVITRPELVNQRGADIPVLLSDSSRFRSATGWEPKISFKETLESVYNYYLAQNK